MILRAVTHLSCEPPEMYFQCPECGWMMTVVPVVTIPLAGDPPVCPVCPSCVAADNLKGTGLS